VRRPGAGAGNVTRRVLLVSPSAKPGGAERALAGVARHLPEYGWQVSALLLENGPLAGWLEAAGCSCVVLPAHRTREVHRSLITVGRLARLVRSTRADVVLSNMDKGHVFGGLASALVGRPAVLWQHGIPSNRHRIPSGRLEKVAAIIPKASVIASCNLAVAAQQRVTRAPVRKVAPGIAVNEVAAALGRGSELRATLGWEGKTVIGIVGRLQPWKGQEVFLQAAALLARKRPDLQFCVVGGAILGWEGSYEADLHAYAEHDPALGDRVYFTGHQEDVYPWMDALDIVVHASFGEPFGLVLVEAMALAKPLVATDEGGPSEIVEDGVSGLLVRPGDPEALVWALRRILDEVGLSDRLTTGARARANEFTEETMAAGVAAVLDEVVQSS
jgi:glycosyltransferase involved in cell wall biosynthesis